MLALAIPAAYALAIRPVHKWRDVLFFFISTKFLPVVASILPIWILARELQLLNTRTVLIILYTGINLPLAVWMLRSFFQEIPRELIEAAEIDGAGLRGQLTSIILPLAAPGIAATALLCVIFAWNEFFYAVQLNPVDGSTVPIWVTTNISTRGDFLAKLSAASVLACIPVVLAGAVGPSRRAADAGLAPMKHLATVRSASELVSAEGRHRQAPAVFLMDEPLSNLDAKLRVQTRTEVVELQARLGVTTVYVTHDQVEAMTMGHRVAVLKDGDPPAVRRAEARSITSPTTSSWPASSARRR